MRKYGIWYQYTKLRLDQFLYCEDFTTVTIVFGYFWLFLGKKNDSSLPVWPNMIKVKNIIRIKVMFDK